MKHIILCADDYGQNLGLSQAIITLLEKNCLSATSCLTNGMHWPAAALELKPFLHRADIGLHLNLTEGKPLSGAFKAIYGDNFFSLSQLLMLAFFRRLHLPAIEAEFTAQLHRFREYLGVLPAFLDGHQHIHQFPGIRDIILKLHACSLKEETLYIRSVDNQKNASSKQLILQILGAHTFKKQLIKHGISHNTSFAGVYNFRKASAYAEIFPRFLQQVEEGGLIMCHPGEKSDGDSIGFAREQEFRYFMSEQFQEECLRQHTKISRFNDIVLCRDLLQ